MFPPSTKPPEKNVVAIPYEKTMVEMFEDLGSEIKTLDSNLYLYLYISAQLTWNIMNINITQNSRLMDLGHCSKKS